jgi:hypothetical protein
VGDNSWISYDTEPHKRIAAPHLRSKWMINKTSWATRFWYKALLFTARRRLKSSFACANRFERSGFYGPFEVTIIIRDTRSEDGYSREELINMLKCVRKHETVSGWKVPEFNVRW